MEFEKLVGLVESTIDGQYFEQYKQFRIKPDIDERLAEVDGEIQKADSKARKELEKVTFDIFCGAHILNTNYILGV